MIVVFDSSALVKRGAAERESDELERAILDWGRNGDLAASGLAWIEVSRAIRRRREPDSPRIVADAIEFALSGIAEFPLTPSVLALARTIEPRGLRSLDAIHLSSAILLDADLVVGYDDRLLQAAEEHGLRVASPGR